MTDESRDNAMPRRDHGETTARVNRCARLDGNCDGQVDSKHDIASTGTLKEREKRTGRYRRGIVGLRGTSVPLASAPKPSSGKNFKGKTLFFLSTLSRLMVEGEMRAGEEMKESSAYHTVSSRGLLTFSNGYLSPALLRANDPLGVEGVATRVEQQEAVEAGRKTRAYVCHTFS